ncbi:ABC transporter substrate-binding protein [Elstera cyanobacteriorum]|uniref:ABC transporter substrate-binding protein n=1 Tax=Elstera cyanobacteriorum TaxID=2022747 RepID=UPI002357A306|nr:ABC transporter substrate-binding protein [Elstera cyanobacteriorum]MCK6441306.1 ABC transporter substrate-binding protein [Elstera cyanobacteriorum]
MNYRTLTLASVSMAAALLAGTVQAKTLIFCSEGSPENFSPARATSGTTSTAAAETIYSRLLDFERGTTNLVNSLAEKYEVSADGKVYTFKLRKGVKFHTTSFFKPTREMNADDVIFSIERQWKKDHPYNPVGGGKYQYFDDLGMSSELEKVEKVDDLTVRLTIKEPLSPFITNIAMPFMSVYSKEYADQLQKQGKMEEIDLKPVGTGPFVFVDYVKDSTIRYKTNPDYFEGKSSLDGLVFAITPDAAQRVNKLKAGECNVAAYPNPADIEALKKEANLKVVQQAGLNVGYISFNTEKAPFGDKRVRQALNLAVNKKTILDAIYPGGIGEIAKNPIPPVIGWAYNNDIKDYAYDPEAAKKLLAEAGVPADTEVELWAMPVARPYNPNAKRMAEVVQADWAKVGIKAKIVSYEWADYLKRVRAGEHQTVMLGWTGDTGDPDNFMFELLGCGSAKTGGNNARWCNAAYEELIQKARKTSDRAERGKLYKEAQVIFKDEAPWLTVAHAVQTVPMAKNVEGFKVDPLGRFKFYGVSMK